MVRIGPYKKRKQKQKEECHVQTGKWEEDPEGRKYMKTETEIRAQRSMELP